MVTKFSSTLIHGFSHVLNEHTDLLSITDVQSGFKMSRPVEFNDLVLTGAGLSSCLLKTILVLLHLM